MNKTFSIAIAIAIVLGLGLGVGVSAWQVGNRPQSAGRAPTQVAGRVGANGAQTQNGAAPAQAQGQVFRPVSGTIEKVDAKSMTLQAQSGTVQVALAENTTYTKLETAAVADLKPDSSVLVMGQQEGDVLSATSVQLLGEGETPQAGGSPGPGMLAGQANQAGPSGQNGVRRSRVSGKVQSVDGQTLTVAGNDGTTTKVAIASTTTVQKSAAAAASDLKAGMNVTVVGDTAADGTVTARAVQIMPGKSGG